MTFGKLALGVVLVAACALPALAELTPDSPDPWLWLTDIHGAKPLAWVKEQNDKSFAVLKSDPDYQKDYDAILKVLDANDRIADGELDHGDVLNFWQDAGHVRGIWRKTTIADYRKAQPKWETILDIDKLDADEKAQWVWQGADCLSDNVHCLVRLSPGGGDATTIREFNPTTRTFVAGGFALPLAKLNAAYLDADDVLVATDFGPGSITKSSYPRIVKLWHRAQRLSAARTIFEAKPDDVSAAPVVLRGAAGDVPLIIRGLDAFTAEFYYVLPNGTTMKLPLPITADLKGVTGGNLIFTLREAWTPPGGQPIAKGALVAFALKPVVMQKMLPVFHVLYTPDARSTVGDVGAGRDAVYASIFQNVTGSIHAFRPNADGSWSDTRLDMPQGGSTNIVSVNQWGPEAFFSYESFLQPVTLYATDGSGAPAAIKAEPARFDASNLVSEQFWVTSADGTQVPYFYIHPKNQKGALPTILYSYGGFELSLFPWYWNDGHRPLAPGEAWFAKGGAIAVANIRGGGEFGPAWHQAALLKHRQRAFDDFEAVAADLVKRGFSTHQQIGSVGASNGGLLVTATIAQRPDLFGAVVCQRPLIDMLRYTKFGAGASWTGEYGDPANARDRAWILKYSSY